MTWKSCPYSVRELEWVGLWNVCVRRCTLICTSVCICVKSAAFHNVCDGWIWILWNFWNRQREGGGDLWNVHSGLAKPSSPPSGRPNDQMTGWDAFHCARQMWCRNEWRRIIEGIFSKPIYPFTHQSHLYSRPVEFENAARMEKNVHGKPVLGFRVSVDKVLACCSSLYRSVAVRDKSRNIIHIISRQREVNNKSTLGEEKSETAQTGEKTSHLHNAAFRRELKSRHFPELYARRQMTANVAPGRFLLKLNV